MPTALDISLSSRDGDRTAMDDKSVSPATDVMHCIYFRHHRGEKWTELFASIDPEEVWRWFLEFRENGAFRFVERPGHLFDSCERGGR